ncbi:hypothetical protein [Flavobacterium sp. SM2513]|uniref:hypothetical protein n=1 Tax=Flavobacterium sp. SM2513 TaxID=3424766 RepID=UPI003D7F3301
MKPEKTTQEAKKPVHKRYIPAAEVNLAAVLAVVARKWSENPWLVLRWLTLATFTAEVSSFTLLLNQQQKAIATRPQLVRMLKNLEHQMDDSLSYVKGYISDKFQKERAKSYYASFGIEHHKNRYSLPIDREKRLMSLKLLLKALVKNDFETKEYGTAFWTPIKENYETLSAQLSHLNGQISLQSGEKRLLKVNLKKGLNALILNIKSNYPDTYKQELRNWGFQKEKY